MKQSGELGSGCQKTRSPTRGIASCLCYSQKSVSMSNVWFSPLKNGVLELIPKVPYLLEMYKCLAVSPYVQLRVLSFADIVPLEYVSTQIIDMLTVLEAQHISSVLV